MSEQSIRHQYQLGLEISDSRVVWQLVCWFDKLWDKKEAKRIGIAAVQRLIPLWPTHEPSPGPTTKGRLPMWSPPEPPLDRSQFTIGVSNRGLKQLLAEFRSNKCKYRDDGLSCSEVARLNEKLYKECSKQFRSLWRRRTSWNKVDLEELFNLAYTHGRAAQIGKPQFVREDPGRLRGRSVFARRQRGPLCSLRKSAQKPVQTSRNG